MKLKELMILKATIVECIIGIFAFDKEEKLIDYKLFPKDAEKIAETLEKMQNEEVINEIFNLVNRLKSKGYYKFIFESEILAHSIKDEFGVEVKVKTPSKAGKKVRQNISKIAKKVGYVISSEEIQILTHEVTVIVAKNKIQKTIGKKDRLIIQAISALDDVDKTLNLFSGRMREWYSIHFPELDKLIDRHETYFRLVMNLRSRQNFTVNNIQELGFPFHKAETISNASKTSMGANLNQEDLEEIWSFIKIILELHDSRMSFENYIDKLMSETAPNIKALVGSTLGARLIAIAGGLTKLSKMPSSKIQVLGAEKALFRSMRTGTKPPKHGIIFQYPHVHKSPRWQRGKIARTLASKLMIAARIDTYSGRYVGDELKAQLKKRINEISEKYKTPVQKRVKRRIIDDLESQSA